MAIMIVNFNHQSIIWYRLANTAIPRITATGGSMPFYADLGTPVGFASFQVYSVVEKVIILKDAIFSRDTQSFKNNTRFMCLLV